MLMTRRRIHFLSLRLARIRKPGGTFHFIPLPEQLDILKSLLQPPDNAGTSHCEAAYNARITVSLHDTGGELRGWVSQTNSANQDSSCHHNDNQFRVCHFIIFQDGTTGYEVNPLGPQPSYLCRYIENKAGKIIDEASCRLLWTHDVVQRLVNISRPAELYVLVNRDAETAISRHSSNIGRVIKAAGSLSRTSMVQMRMNVRNFRSKGIEPEMVNRIVSILDDVDTRQCIEWLWLKSSNNMIDLLKDGLIPIKSVQREEMYFDAVDSNSMYQAIVKARQELAVNIIDVLSRD